MKVYAGIDLHSSNNYIEIINEKDERLYQKRLMDDPLIAHVPGLPQNPNHMHILQPFSGLALYLTNQKYTWIFLY